MNASRFAIMRSVIREGEREVKSNAASVVVISSVFSESILGRFASEGSPAGADAARFRPSRRCLSSRAAASIRCACVFNVSFNCILRGLLGGT